MLLHEGNGFLSRDLLAVLRCWILQLRQALESKVPPLQLSGSKQEENQESLLEPRA